MTPDKKKIAIIGGHNTSQNNLISGVLRYRFERFRWSIASDAAPGEFHADERISLDTLNGFECDGVLYIGRDQSSTSPAEVRGQLESLGVPIVYTSPMSDIGYCTPCVVPDDRAIGRLMAEYFLNLGFRNFAFYTIADGYPFLQLREASFTETISTAGYSCNVIREKAVFTKNRYAELANRLQAWLRALPKPIAVGACFDGFAAELICQCREIGLRVPEEVAFLGVYNKTTTCLATNPPLSSVDVNLPECGYRASLLLERLMAGEKAPTKPIFIPPTGIVVRGSSDTIMIDDPDVAQWVHYIRAHLDEGITVQQLADHANISLRSLQMRFKKALQHSPGEEIRRIRIDKASELLRETNLSMIQIAQACGFSNQTSFGTTFKRIVGQTPTEYRNQR